MATASAGQHHVIKEASESVGQLLHIVFKESGYKRVHLVVAAPKQEAIEGKLPAISVYLYNISSRRRGPRLQSRRATSSRPSSDSDGRMREVAARHALWVRLDYL